jgi:hypothetical protein
MTAEIVSMMRGAMAVALVLTASAMVVCACRGRIQAALPLAAAAITALFIFYVADEGDQRPFYQMATTIGLGHPWLGMLGLAVALIVGRAAGPPASKEQPR